MLPSHVFLDVLQALSRLELDAMKFSNRTLNSLIRAHSTRPRSKAVVVCQYDSCFTVYDEAYSIHYVPFDEAECLLGDCVVMALQIRRWFSAIRVRRKAILALLHLQGQFSPSAYTRFTIDRETAKAFFMDYMARMCVTPTIIFDIRHHHHHDGDAELAMAALAYRCVRHAKELRFETDVERLSMRRVFDWLTDSGSEHRRVQVRADDPSKLAQVHAPFVSKIKELFASASASLPAFRLDITGTEHTRPVRDETCVCKSADRQLEIRTTRKRGIVAYRESSFVTTTIECNPLLESSQ